MAMMQKAGPPPGLLPLIIVAVVILGLGVWFFL